jgi:hypothetical protein
MERTQPVQVGAMPHQLHAARFGQSLQRYFTLQPFDCFIGNAWYAVSLLATRQLTYLS